MAIVEENNNKYFYYGDLGKYALVKYNDEIKDNTIYRELVKEAYINNNMSIDEYINYLSDECHVCGFDLNYVQKYKMKRYLERNI